MSGPSNPPEKIVHAFHDEYWRDRAAGEDRGLGHYLERFPDDELTVAREFLAADERAVECRDPEPDSDRLGPYELEEEIGRGGQGIVYRALDTRLGRRVALKVLRGLGPGAQTHLRRFRREAEIASRLDHAGICAVHDMGLERGVPFIAMQYIEGQTLDRRWRRAGPVLADEFVDVEAPVEPVPAERSARSSSGAELEEILVVFERCARALHAAHDAGVIHRDVKPGNIMVSRDGQPVILDFGLACDGQDDASLTGSGEVFGTPAYMSPEQVTGQRVQLDRRTDVYSLGVSLYENLTGRRPFEAVTREGVYQAILMKEPVDPRRFNRAISSDLAVVVETAMAKDRDRRYATAAALADDLAAVREGRAIVARPLGPLGRAARWARRRPARAALLAITLVGLPVLGVLAAHVVVTMDDVAAHRRAITSDRIERAIEEGFFQLHVGKPEAARRAFAEAVDLDVRVAEATLGLVLTHLELKEPQSALAALDRIAGSDAAAGALLGMRATVLRALDRSEEAGAAERAMPPPDDALSWFIAGTQAIHEGHAAGAHSREAQAAFIRARAHLERAVYASPRVRRAYHFELAHAVGHLVEQDPTEVDELLDVIEARWPDDYLGRYWSGYLALSTRPRRAIVACRRAIELAPQAVTVRAILAEAESAVGQHREAAQTFLEASRLESRNGELLLCAAADLRRVGEVEEPIRVLRAGVERFPDNPYLRVSLASELHSAGDPAAAWKVNDDALERFPDHGGVCVQRAAWLAADGRHEEALAMLVRAEPSRWTDPRFSHGLYIYLLDVLGRRDRAIAAGEEALRRTTSASPCAYNLRLNLSLLYGLAGRPAESIRAARDAIRVDPDGAGAHRNLGAVLLLEGRHEESCRALLRACELLRSSDPERHLPSTETILGRAAEAWVDGIGAVDERRRATVVLRRAVELFPDNRQLVSALEEVDG